jgi:hypothetical protein
MFCSLFYQAIIYFSLFTVDLDRLSFIVYTLRTTEIQGAIFIGHRNVNATRSENLDASIKSYNLVYIGNEPRKINDYREKYRKNMLFLNGLTFIQIQTLELDICRYAEIEA